MKFGHARCELCRGDLFDPSGLVSFRRIAGGIDRMDLTGRQPWSGIVVVCFPCAVLLSDALPSPSGPILQWRLFL